MFLRSFALVVTLILSFVLGTATVEAQCVHRTACGQYGSAPAGRPGQTVTVNAWLGLPGRTGFMTPLLGRVEVQLLSGGRWTSVGSISASRTAVLYGGSSVAYGGGSRCGSRPPRGPAPACRYASPSRREVPTARRAARG